MTMSTAKALADWKYTNSFKEKKSESVSRSVMLTLCDSMDCSLPGSPVHGVLQVRILE